MEDLDREVARLQRVDFRLNRELVAKPYQYIDKVKEALDKEQREIVNIVKSNNDKYISKIGQMDQKVNKVLTDTETLLDQYRKKITDIGKNLESTKRFREDINVAMNALKRNVDRISGICDQNHIDSKQHLDRISLKFAESTIDLKSANEGFQRELERLQLLFRELQQEFLQQLEEKREHNEALLRGAGIEENELKMAKNQAKSQSNKNMSTLLPKLRKTHIDSNIMLTGRQEKILALLRGDKLSP